jgi:hypothetical protein
MARQTDLLEAVSLLGPGQGLRGRDYGELARKDGPGGWAVAATVMSLEGVVEIGTGFGLAGGSEGTGRRSVRIAGKDQSAGALSHYVQLVWVIPEMDGLFTGPAPSAAASRPADARHRSKNERLRGATTAPRASATAYSRCAIAAVGGPRGADG